MSDDMNSITRRRTLKRIGLATTAAVTGVTALSGSAAGATAEEAGLQVTDSQPDSVALAWNDLGADTYHVYWFNRESRNNNRRTFEGAEGTIPVSAGTRYYIWLGAMAGGDFTWYGPLRETTPEQGSSGGSDGSDGSGGSDDSGGSGSASFTERVEGLIHEKVNERRQNNGLESLGYNDDIAAVARGHSEYMARNDHLSHTQKDGDTMTDRLEQGGLRCMRAGENILYNYSADESPSAAAEQSVEQWMGSSGHRQNILGNFAVQGVGVATTDQGRLYATEVLGTQCE